MLSYEELLKYAKVEFDVEIAWWFEYYYYLIFMGSKLGFEPDEEKIVYWLDKAITLEDEE